MHCWVSYKLDQFHGSLGVWGGYWQDNSGSGDVKDTYPLSDQTEDVAPSNKPIKKGSTLLNLHLGWGADNSSVQGDNGHPGGNPYYPPPNTYGASYFQPYMQVNNTYFNLHCTDDGDLNWTSPNIPFMGNWHS